MRVMRPEYKPKKVSILYLLHDLKRGELKIVKEYTEKEVMKVET